MDLVKDYFKDPWKGHLVTFRDPFKDPSKGHLVEFRDPFKDPFDVLFRDPQMNC